MLGLGLFGRCYKVTYKQLVAVYAGFEAPGEAVMPTAAFSHMCWARDPFLGHHDVSEAKPLSKRYKVL